MRIALAILLAVMIVSLPFLTIVHKTTETSEKVVTRLGTGIETFPELEIGCSLLPVYGDFGTAYLPTSISQLFKITIKNVYGQDVTVDKAVLLTSTGQVAGVVNISKKLEPYQSVELSAPVNVGNLVISGKAYAGDVFIVKGDKLVKEEEGLVATFWDGTFLDPNSYISPFKTKYTINPNIDINDIWFSVSEPTTAPYLIYDSELATPFIVFRVRPVKWRDNETDISFYIHAYSFPQETYGFYLTAGGEANFLSLFFSALPNKKVYTDLDGYYSGYYYLYNGKEEFGIAVSTFTHSVATVSSAGKVVIGIARARRVENKGQLAIFFDGSGSMGPEIKGVLKGIEEGLEELSKKNIEVTIGDFTDRRGCPFTKCFYKDWYARILSDFTKDYELIKTNLARYRTTGGEEDGLHIADVGLKRLGWSSDRQVPKMIVLISDENPHKYVSYDPQAVLDEAKRMGIPITVVVASGVLTEPPTGMDSKFTWKYIAEYTGGYIFTYQDDNSVQATKKVKEAILTIIKNLQVPSGELRTNVKSLLVFKSPTITIKNLWVGDKLLIQGTTSTLILNVNSTTMTIDLRKYFTPEEIAETFDEIGYFKITIIPSLEHQLAIAPNQVMLHVSGDGLDAWLSESIKIVPTCTPRLATTNKDNTIVIVNNGGLFNVTVRTTARDYPFATGKKVYITAIGYKGIIELENGTVINFEEGDTLFNMVELSPSLTFVLTNDEIIFVKSLQPYATISVRVRKFEIKGSYVYVKVTLSA